MTFYAVCTPGGSQVYTLIVDANGGTWNGDSIYAFQSTMVGVTQSLTPDPTKTITITYNENGQGATFSNTTQSVQATFNKWTLSGAGTLSGTTYTFEAGDGTVTASYNESEYVLQSITKNGYICKWAEGSASGTQYTGGTSRTITENKTYYAVCTINSYKLTVKPNGGTWDGKTTSQDFTQNYGTTKTIAAPSSGPAYSISYNMNGTGITAPTSPVSVQRPFTSWTKDGGGTLNGTTYTFGSSNGTLTANYNTTSSSFTLPSISKSGYTCKWAEGSASGTQYTGGTSRTITGNKTYYAGCTANTYTITYDANGGSGAPSATTYTYATSGTINLSTTKPTKSGYTFTSWNSNKNGDGTNYGAGSAWGLHNASNYTIFAKYCQNCPTVANGTNTLSTSPAGSCTCTISCNAGYKLENGVCVTEKVEHTSSYVIARSDKDKLDCRVTFDYSYNPGTKKATVTVKKIEFKHPTDNSYWTNKYGGQYVGGDGGETDKNIFIGGVPIEWYNKYDLQGYSGSVGYQDYWSFYQGSSGC